MDIVPLVIEWPGTFLHEIKTEVKDVLKLELGKYSSFRACSTSV